jgi:hypothetical protein
VRTLGAAGGVSVLGAGPRVPGLAGGGAVGGLGVGGSVVGWLVVGWVAVGWVAVGGVAVGGVAVGGVAVGGVAVGGGPPALGVPAPGELGVPADPVDEGPVNALPPLVADVGADDGTGWPFAWARCVCWLGVKFRIRR